MVFGGYDSLFIYKHKAGCWLPPISEAFFGRRASSHEC